MLNKIIIQGEVNYFTLANYRNKNQDICEYLKFSIKNEHNGKFLYINITIFSSWLVKQMQHTLKNGMYVIVEGNLTNFKTKEGAFKTSINGTNIHILDNVVVTHDQKQNNNIIATNDPLIEKPEVEEKLNWGIDKEDGTIEW